MHNQQKLIKQSQNVHFRPNFDHFFWAKQTNSPHFQAMIVVFEVDTFHHKLSSSLLQVVGHDKVGRSKVADTLLPYLKIRENSIGLPILR